MKFTVKSGMGFSDEGIVYNAPVIARKLNGFIVRWNDGTEGFVCKSDIDVIEISAEEKEVKVRWDY